MTAIERRVRRNLAPYFSLLLACLHMVASASAQTVDKARQTAHVTITRDDWGIAHVHGTTDADAVFGMIYAQCEDDFDRVERNYLTALGRTAEADGETALWQDLRQRLFINPEDLKADYAKSPAWLRALMDAWADGINFYLAKHPDVKPLVLTHFEPWMALSFTEGSIGGDIEKVDLKAIEAFYTTADAEHQANLRAPIMQPHRMSGYAATALAPPQPLEPGGSNGFAIAPANTLNHRALLLINPHTSFFFRSELQVSSDEGLNAYGAVTWGQFFIYQGFNERAGWMHTSSNVDAVDQFLEARAIHGDTGTYMYGTESRPYLRRMVTLRYKTATGTRNRTFNTWATAHGPVTGSVNAGFITTSLMNKPIEALEQSYVRTKAHTYAEYSKTMELFANSSNNTVFADADGNIAYWHGNFIPRRNPRFDYTKPVDGSDPATDWHGLLTLDQIPHLLNPASGFLFNVNDSPWNGSGASSLKQSDYPAYVEQGIETARGVHAARVLNGHKDFTLDSLLTSAYDSFLPWFARTLPALLAAQPKPSPNPNPLSSRSPNPLSSRSAAEGSASPTDAMLTAPLATLRAWDNRWSAASIATTLAVFWGTELMKTEAAHARAAKIPSEDWIATRTPSAVLLNALTAAVARLNADFGTWQTRWGQVNRFQRLNGDLQQPFSDAAPSIPVPFTSSLWGSLASFAARPYPGTKKWYGTSGNSFVAVVEFTPGRVRARAVTAGGESGHPASKHFNDEAQRYATGNLRDVYFYPDQLANHTERTYKPGQ